MMLDLSTRKRGSGGLGVLEFSIGENFTLFIILCVR